MVQYTLVYIHSVKHFKLKMINFQRVIESRKKDSQEARLRTTGLEERCTRTAKCSKTNDFFHL